MIFFRACPRCSGDLVRSRDWYGRYDECLQCGYERNIAPVRGTRRRVQPFEAGAPLFALALPGGGATFRAGKHFSRREAG